MAVGVPDLCAPNLIDGEVADLLEVKILSIRSSILWTPCNFSDALVVFRCVVDVLQYPSLSWLAHAFLNGLLYNKWILRFVMHPWYAILLMEN